MSYTTYTLGGTSFDAVPSESVSENSGLVTDTTVSKKIIYWIGARTESLTLQCNHMTSTVRDAILALITTQQTNPTPIVFNDGIDTKNVLIASFNTQIVVGIEEPTGLYTATITLQTIS